MFKGRSNNSGSRGGFRGTSSARVTGLFSDGVWHCNCDPRLPAEHFKVKKEGRNQGRWFYTCQKAQTVRCDFFLWEEDAKPREEAALLNNSRSEPQVQGQRNPSTSVADRFTRIEDHAHSSQSTDSQNQSPPPPYTVVSGISALRSTGAPASRKRKLPWQTGTADDETDDEEESFPWPLTGEEEQQLSQTVDRMPPPETPRKALKTSIWDTPTKTGLPTPTSPERPIPPGFDNRSASASAFSPLRQPHFTGPTTPPRQEAEAPISQAVTPSPSRTIDFTDSSPQLTLQSEVATLLFANDISLPPEVHSSLRSILHKHELRLAGSVKGREAVRLSAKAKDAKIAELQARIQLLEAERETDKAVIGHLRRTVG